MFPHATTVPTENISKNAVTPQLRKSPNGITSRSAGNG